MQQTKREVISECLLCLNKLIESALCVEGKNQMCSTLHIIRTEAMCGENMLSKTPVDLPLQWWFCAVHLHDQRHSLITSCFACIMATVLLHFLTVQAAAKYVT